MKKITIVNYKSNQCGIHQYGWNLYQSLKTLEPDYQVNLMNVDSFESANNVLNSDGTNYAFYNSPLHMTRNFFNSLRENKNRVNFYVIHDTSHIPNINLGEDKFYQYAVMGDPTLSINNDRIIKIGRTIWNYANKYELPKTITIGSYGFLSPSKGYEYLINKVQEEFDEAIIRINIPLSNVGSNQNIEETKLRARHLYDLINKSGIKLEITYNFFTNEELLDFLAQNTLNAFLYTQDNNSQLGGIASSLDSALSARRPIAITNCSMFRHVLNYHLPINVPQNSLKQIIDNGVEILEPIFSDWTQKKIAENILKFL